MDAKTLSLVQRSFEKIMKMDTDEVMRTFYNELFSIEPALKIMFRGDIKDQRPKLMAALLMAVRGIHTPQKISTQLKDLAKKHLDYGVQAEHYALFGNALMRALQKTLGDDFTPELRSAWAEAYRTIANIMKEEVYGKNAD